MLKYSDICLTLAKTCVFIIKLFNFSWNVHVYTLYKSRIVKIFQTPSQVHPPFKISFCEIGLISNENDDDLSGFVFVKFCWNSGISTNTLTPEKCLNISERGVSALELSENDFSRQNRLGEQMQV